MKPDFPKRCLACEEALEHHGLVFAVSKAGKKDICFCTCSNCHSLNSELYDRANLYDDRTSTNYSEGTNRFLLWMKRCYLQLDYGRFVRKIGTNDVVVDYGCGGGELSSSLVALGLNKVVAADLQELRPSSLDPKVHYVSLSKMNDVQPNYVFARHVWEHIEDPISALKKLHAMLPIGARVIIEVPNSGSLLRKFMGRRWPGYFAPYHTIIYSKSGLEQLCHKARFTIEEILVKESPVLGQFFLDFGLPRTGARLASATLFPLQAIASKIAGRGESLVVLLRK